MILHTGLPKKAWDLYDDLRLPQWTRVNLNSNRTEPCAGLCDVRQVPARPYTMQARFQLWWRGQTFTVPGLSKVYFTYPTRLVRFVPKGQKCVFILNQNFQGCRYKYFYVFIFLGTSQSMSQLFNDQTTFKEFRNFRQHLPWNMKFLTFLRTLK